MNKASALLILSILIVAGVVHADNVSNNIDASIDATLENIDLTVGGPTGTVSFIIDPANGDGKNGCNLTASSILTVTVNTSDSDVAVVSPSTITFASCGDVKPITVTSVGEGIAIISLSETVNTTAGTFDLNPAKFNVNVTSPVLSDATPPEIVVTLNPEANENGWNNTPVNIVWTINDAESEYSIVEGCEDVTLDEETDGTELTCSAESEGGEDTESVTVKIDMTAPIITGTAMAEPNINGWYNADVSVEFSCAETGDVQSGIETDTVEGDTLDSEGSDQSIANSGGCIDAAGNSALVATVSGINIDKTAPEIFINVPEDGGSYTYNQTVLADWTADDSLSGLDEVTATTPNGEPVSTTPVEEKLFTVSATDLAGNPATVTHTYAVVPYTFGGCKPPLALDSKDFKKTSTIPVKCAFTTTANAPVMNAAITLLVNGAPATASGGSNTGHLFRFSPTDAFWIYNLSTKQLIPKSANILSIGTDDGASPHTYTIQVK